jgi:hypothetical protein
VVTPPTWTSKLLLRWPAYLSWAEIDPRPCPASVTGAANESTVCCAPATMPRAVAVGPLDLVARRAGDVLVDRGERHVRGLAGLRRRGGLLALEQPRDRLVAGSALERHHLLG